MTRILVVDDDADTGALIVELLAREGIDGTSFQDPAVALERLVEDDFDVVLTDVNMPRMDGLEFCERVLGARPELPEKIRDHRARAFGVATDREEDIVSIDELHRTYVNRVLTLLAGNKTRTAQALGIDRRTLYRKLEGWAGSSAATR